MLIKIIFHDSFVCLFFLAATTADAVAAGGKVERVVVGRWFWAAAVIKRQLER
jgi:hypothetical protein